MSLINSIFVDAMVSDNNDELDLKVDEIRKILEQMQAALAAQGVELKQNNIQSNGLTDTDATENKQKSDECSE